MALNQAVEVLSTATLPTETQILPVNIANITFIQTNSDTDIESDGLDIDDTQDCQDLQNLHIAAQKLREGDVPVAFPTETVYGLGADATRSSAVKGIYKAKQRPADNPLIVHVGSLAQLRKLLYNNQAQNTQNDPIPQVYKPLIHRFWPGPLTIILPNPSDSPLASEVTAGLSTFGARMPRNKLARSLIRLAGVPLAAPSANASTRPSPTAAEHVKEDLDGRIEIILDGGPCDVGLESTVVDGLSDAPQILRPGGISIKQIRQCAGWENVEIGYKNAAEGVSKPKAPGMKYKHYSPKAKVVLFDGGSHDPSSDDLLALGSGIKSFGVVRTKRWIPMADPLETERSAKHAASINGSPQLFAKSYIELERRKVEVWDVHIGPTVEDIARQLFSVLRELDRRGVQVILIEGIDESEGDLAAAILNRLRKAAETTVTGNFSAAQ